MVQVQIQEMYGGIEDWRNTTTICVTEDYMLSKPKILLETPLLGSIKGKTIFLGLGQENNLLIFLHKYVLDYILSTPIRYINILWKPTIFLLTLIYILEIFFSLLIHMSEIFSLINTIKAKLYFSPSSP
jgi:hypothetical protein